MSTGFRIFPQKGNFATEPAFAGASNTGASTLVGLEVGLLFAFIVRCAFLSNLVNQFPSRVSGLADSIGSVGRDGRPCSPTHLDEMWTDFLSCSIEGIECALLQYLAPRIGW